MTSQLRSFQREDLIAGSGKMLGAGLQPRLSVLFFLLGSTGSKSCFLLLRHDQALPTATVAVRGDARSIRPMCRWQPRRCTYTY